MTFKIKNILEKNTYNIIFIDGILIYQDKKKEFIVIENNNNNKYIKSKLNKKHNLLGLKLKIKKKKIIKKNILITYINSTINENYISNYCNNIIIESNSKVFIKEEFINIKNKYSAINIHTKINQYNSSNVYFDIINEGSYKLLTTIFIKINLNRNSKFELFQFSSKLSLSRYYININLNEKNANFCSKGIYIINNKSQIDSYYNINHLSSNTISNINFYGVLNNESKSIFNAKTYVKNNTKNIFAIQNNKNIQIKNESEIHSKPELEVYSNDVTCSHGSTIGFINKKILFYLRSRSIIKKIAIKIIIEGFIKNIFNEINRNEKVLKKYFIKIKNRIKALNNK